MKKSLILLLASCFALGGCDFMDKVKSIFNGGSTKHEEVPYDNVPGGDSEYVTTCTSQFYLSYSHTSKYDLVVGAEINTPLFVLKDVPMLKPLGVIPEEVSTKEKVLALAEEKGFSYDPAFDKFLGFSKSTVCLDEEGLWDFSKDYRQLATITLYGVWVSE